MVTELLQKYIWLVQTIIRAGHHGLSLNEISDRWDNRWDNEYSRRTFNNHRAAIEDIFGIRIKCNRSTNCYFIDSAEDVSDESAASAWLINTFTVNNILSMSKERLSGRISVEDIPSGHLYLTGIMEAMTDNFEIIIEYQKYTSSQKESLTLRPYALKEFAKRWYLVAFCMERNGVRVYGLDRIKSLSITSKRFNIKSGFDVDELFATSFGIYLTDNKARTITFRTPENEARFLYDLPIHKSQEVIEEKEGFVTFSIFVSPDKNMIMEFCKHGSKLEVLSPADVRETIAEELRAATDLYKDKEQKKV